MAEFKNISIRTKLILIQVATAFIAVLICCTIFVINNIKVFKEASVSSKNSIAEIVGINAAPTLEFMDRDAATEMLLKLKSNPSILNALILDKNGKQFARYNKQGEESFSFPAPDASEKKEQNNFGQRFIVSYRITDKDFLGTVMLRAEISGFREIIFNYLKIALVILLASLAAAFLISTFFQRTITNRLLSLVHKTKEVTETGNYSLRVPAEGQDEIGVLSGAFNNMLVRIEKMEKSLNQTNAELESRVKKRTSELESANKELEAFTFSVSHDLRTPLRAIHGYAGILREDYSAVLDAEGKLLLERVSKNARQMGTLIDDLLDFSRLGRKEVTKSEVNMSYVAAEALAEINKSTNHSAQVQIDDLGSAMVDAALMKHVMTNLLSNAIKYSSKKEKPVVHVQQNRTNGKLVYSVSDNGAGFNMKYANKLFGVFQRLHTDKEFEGTGVGLAIVERIINKHGGKVWAEAKEGEGATFYFSLPEITQN